MLISICQRKYAIEILQDYDLLTSKPASFPMESNLKLSRTTGKLLEDPTANRRLVGGLLYLTITRPDISYSVQILSQFMDSPRQPHLDVENCVLRYLKSSPTQGLFYSANSSIQGDLLLFMCFSQPSAKAEYRSMASTTCELIWLVCFRIFMSLILQQLFFFVTARQLFIYIAANPMYHERSKHIEFDCYLVRDRDKIQQGVIRTLNIHLCRLMLIMKSLVSLPSFFF